MALAKRVLACKLDSSELSDVARAIADDNDLPWQHPTREWQLCLLYKYLTLQTTQPNNLNLQNILQTQQKIKQILQASFFFTYTKTLKEINI